MENGEKKRLIYIYTSPSSLYQTDDLYYPKKNGYFFVCDSTIGIRDDGYISAAIGFNPYKDEDVVTRKAMTAHYFTDKVNNFMDFMKFFENELK